MKQYKRNSIRVKLFAALLSLCLLCPFLSSCSTPPELSAISDRFRELVEASKEINMIFYGEGLPTYERVTDPRETTELFENKETGELFHYYTYEDKVYGKVLAYRRFVDDTRGVYTDPETGIKYFYQYLNDKTYGKIVVVDSTSIEGKYYIQLVKAPKEGISPDYVNEAKGEWGYFLKDFSYETDYKENKFTYLQMSNSPHDGGKAFYEDAEQKVYCYLLPDSYEEPIFESYYTESDPTDYDYVTLTAKYHSITEIKNAAAAIYSTAFLESIYDMMFVGTVGASGGVEGMNARYKEHQDEAGNISLMKSNTYKPLIRETRLYLFDTAQIVEPSNGEYVTLSVDSYLPSEPEKILNVKVSMVLENGVWMLDTATY